MIIYRVLSALLSYPEQELIDALPEAAGWDDLARAVDGARFEAAVHAGMAAADQGQIASPAQVTAMFARWGVDVAA